jgi:putative membrane protein
VKTLKKIGFAIAFNMGALLVTVELLESINYTGGWAFFLITGTLIGALNTFLKPILKFVSMPLIFFSAGFFLIIINAGILWMTDELLEILDFSGIDLQIESTVSFIPAAVIFGLTNWFEHWILKRTK